MFLLSWTHERVARTGSLNPLESWPETKGLTFLVAKTSALGVVVGILLSA